MLLYEKKEQDIYVTSWESDHFIPHLHYHYEVLICIRGTIIVTCNNRTEILYPGDVMIAFSNDIHSYTKSAGGTCLLLLLKPDVFPLLSGKISRHKYENFLLNRDLRYLQLANAIWEEYNGDRDWIVLCSSISLLVGLVLKQLPYQSSDVRINQELFTNIISYIAEHYTEPISRKSLANKFFVDPCYISRMFTAHFSIGFHEYLHELRIEHAKHLLAHTDLKISEVYDQSGFTDQKTFNRVFLQYTHYTPRAYRNAVRK